MNSASLKPLQMIGVSLRGHRHHGQQFRLAAGFQAELERLAEFQHFFDHLPLLVHLDRIDAAVVALILLLGHRRLKDAVNFAQPMLQNVGEANQDRQIDAAQLQPIDQLLQVDRALGILRRMHANVPVAVDRKVSVAPARHFVQFGGIDHRPAFQIQIDFQRRALVGGIQNGIGKNAKHGIIPSCGSFCTDWRKKSAVILALARNGNDPHAR